MSLVYLKFGNLQDAEGAGVTVGIEGVNNGMEFVAVNGMHTGGFQREEITKEEYDLWAKRIANPDNVTYFAGIFAGTGVIDAKTRKALDKKIADGNKELCKQQCEANRINFKLAQRDAEAIGEDHEAVFTSKHPKVSEDVKAMLFAEARKAKG